MDKIKKRILLVRHGTTVYNENGQRRWAVVDFWNNTSHLENAL
jgi:broad specificity phosphatase PhoE